MLKSTAVSRLHVIPTALAVLLQLFVPGVIAQAPPPQDVGNAEFSSYLPKVVQDLMKRLAEDDQRIRSFDMELASKLAAKDSEIAAWRARYDDSERQIRRTERINDRLFSAVTALTTQLLAKGVTPAERKLILDQLTKLIVTEGGRRDKQEVKIEVPIQLPPALQLLVRETATNAAQDAINDAIGKPYTVLFSEPFHTHHTLYEYRGYDIRIRIVPGTLTQITDDYKNYHSFVHMRLRSPVQPELREDEAFSIGELSAPRFSTGNDSIPNEWTARIKPIKRREQAIRIVLNGSSSPPLIYPVNVEAGNWLLFVVYWLWYWLTKPAVIAVAAAVVAGLSKVKDVSESTTKLLKVFKPAEASAADAGDHE